MRWPRPTASRPHGPVWCWGGEGCSVILRGIKRDGQFRGLPDRLADGTPRLVASLLARHAEQSGLYDPAVMGMPLGFPPIPDEEIDLINTWIEQGAPE
ncbi:hypothetical protein [Archangium lipolyticum]|uniref:hypothetical protein n=1 Tax=Archangium lipolyticum TaxID=2970465 RepID=UPI002149BC1F|nr:hypothetical protein [Archangium lipolyticum]